MSMIEPAGSVACVWCPSCDRQGAVARPTGRSSMPALGASYRAGWLLCGRRELHRRAGFRLLAGGAAEDGTTWTCFVLGDPRDVKPLVVGMVQNAPR